MRYDDQTPRTSRQIGGKATEGVNAGQEVKFTVQVPQPYAPGTVELTEGEANALNQTVAENLSNNLRAQFIAGRPAIEADKANGVRAEAARPYTSDEAQALVDGYLTDYEIGVRRAGSGEARVSDPIEREARKIARQRAVLLVKDSGGKPADFDMGPITDAIFDQNRELLMAEGAKIVAALDAARQETGGLSVEGISLAPQQPVTGAEPQTEAEVQE